jgi:hypothetical protein
MLRQELSILLFCEGYTYGGGYPVSERQKEYIENKQSNNLQKPSTHVTLQGRGPGSPPLSFCSSLSPQSMSPFRVGVWVHLRSLSVPRSHLNPCHPSGSGSGFTSALFLFPALTSTHVTLQGGVPSSFPKIKLIHNFLKTKTPSNPTPQSLSVRFNTHCRFLVYSSIAYFCVTKNHIA